MASSPCQKVYASWEPIVHQSEKVSAAASDLNIHYPPLEGKVWQMTKRTRATESSGADIHEMVRHSQQNADKFAGFYGRRWQGNIPHQERCSISQVMQCNYH